MTQGRWPERSIGPKTNPDGKYVGDLRDPANGERVPRCAVCGMPDQPKSRLLNGVWSYGSFAMPHVLCERHIPAFDPRSGDPLTAEDAA